MPNLSGNKEIMKKGLKLLKWAGISLVALVLLGFLAVWLFSEKEPEGVAGTEAEQMAASMLKAINKPAWDTTTYVQWTFKGMHSFVWDKKRHLTKVTWDGYDILLDIDKIGGIAKKDGVLLSAEESEAIIRKAWEYWCNDSFWLNAPAKVLDPGTSRSIVKLKDGRKGLKVKYASGGVTPGDAYVWILDENGLPISYKMWVKIIPIGGVEFSWADWKTTEQGAKISTMHEGLLSLDISNLKTGNNYQELGFHEDPFAGL